MELKNVYEPNVLNELLGRLNNIQPDSQRQWGKMSSGQMLAHCAKVLEVAAGDVPVHKRKFIGYLIAPMLRKVLTTDAPFKKNSPTGKEFLTTEETDFVKEKEKLANLLTRFSRDGEKNAGTRKHPYLGKMSGEDWSRSTYKHLDHHFAQFGV